LVSFHREYNAMKMTAGRRWGIVLMSGQLARSFEYATEFPLAVLHGKWKAVILNQLGERPCRYSELRESIPGVSDKMLSQRLHDLLAGGLVAHRRAAASANEQYALTPKGRVVNALVQGMCAWGREHSRLFNVRIGPGVSAVRRRVR
jgi:DNA-binding HxlR family transcriptional regulator